MDIKKMKIDVVYHKIEDGIVEEIKIEEDIYRLVHPGDERKIEEKKEEKELFAAKEKKEPNLDVESTYKNGKILGRDNSYSINIVKSDVNAVLDSLKSGNKTLSSIAEATGLKPYRVGGTLHWLRSKSIIKRKFGKNRLASFRVVKKEWTP